MKELPRILWISDLVTPTGFSRVSHSILDNLTEKYEILGLGINYYGDPHPYTFPIFPAPVQGQIYGFNRLNDIVKKYHFDIIFLLNDVWIIDRYLAVIKEAYANLKKPIPKIVVYFPVDAEVHDHDWYQNFDIVTKAVTYTKFAKKVVEKMGKNIPVSIIPHGVDSETFYQIYPERTLAKKSLFKNNPELHEDSFIFLNANRNQPRKKLDVTLEAFKLFAENKTETIRLYLHSGIRDAGHIDSLKLSKRLGIEDKVLFSNTNMGVQRVPDNILNLIYNSCDVGLNTSTGEGWGLPNMEHAITGAAQIVPKHSACNELYSDVGLVIPAKQDLMLDNLMTIGKLVKASDFAKGMEQLFSDRELYKKISKDTQEKFLSKEYSWKNISETWNQLFMSILCQ